MVFQFCKSEVLLNNRTKKAFISAGGFHSKLGLTCAHQSECQVKKTAISSSVESILLIDSSKFGSVHPCFFAKPDAFAHIITNKDVPGDYKNLLNEENFTVHYA